MFNAFLLIATIGLASFSSLFFGGAIGIPEHVDSHQSLHSPELQTRTSEQDGHILGIVSEQPNQSDDPVTPVSSETFEEPNDPLFPQQWALGQIGVPDTKEMDSRSVIVAVLDTGIDGNHPDLAGLTIDHINFSASSTSGDVNGHGTFIAGIIAAQSNNGIGISGLVPNVHLLDVKVADDKGYCQSGDVAKGIIWAVDHGAEVINISLDFRNDDPELKKAVRYAWESGSVLVAAASNTNARTAVYPAAYTDSIAVVAIRQDGSIGPLVGYGDWVDVSAPGFNIVSLLPGDQYGEKSGTSFATAYVSGMAAALYPLAQDENGDGRVNDEVRSFIESSGRPTDNRYPAISCVDIQQALTFLSNY